MIRALRRTFRRDTGSVGRACVGRGAETCARTRIALLLTREERFTGGKNDTGGAQRGFSRARLRGRPGGYGCLAFSRRRPSRRFALAERPRGRRGPGAGCRVPGRYREAPVTSVVASLQQQTWRIRGGRSAGTINVSDLKGHRLRGRTRRMENPVGFLSLTGLARRPRGSRRNFEWQARPSLACGFSLGEDAVQASRDGSRVSLRTPFLPLRHAARPSGPAASTAA